MVKRKNPVVEFTTGIIWPRLAEGLVLQRAREFRAGIFDNLQRDQTSFYRQWLPKGDYPVLTHRGADWAGFYGGFTFSIKLSTGQTDRVVGLWADPEVARAIYRYSSDTKNYRRGTIYVMFLDGQWVGRVKFRSTEGMSVKANNARGRGVPRSPRGFQLATGRRWAIAPPGWPRDSHGRPLSDRAAAQWRKAHMAGGTT